MSVFSGSYGASRGANTAAVKNTSTRTKPITALGLRISLWNASRQSPLGASNWISLASASATLMSSGSAG